MQAECPNCHTLFRITEAQLDMADGMVRCGYCKEVFNARIANDLQADEDRLQAFKDTSTETHATAGAYPANRSGA